MKNIVREVGSIVGSIVKLIISILTIVILSSSTVTAKEISLEDTITKIERKSSIKEIVLDVKENVEELIKENIESIDFGLKSHHFRKLKDYDYNEFNLGLFINTKWKVKVLNQSLGKLTFGYLHKNSYRNKSFILGLNQDIYKNGKFKVGTKVFVSSGYDGLASDGEYEMKTNAITKKLYGLMPGASLMFEYDFLKLTVNPNPKNLQNSIIYMGFTHSF